MKVKALAYKTFVRPQLEYASSVWAPHTHCNIDRIEAVLRLAARSTMKTGVDQQPATTTGTTQTVVRGSPSSVLQYLRWELGLLGRTQTLLQSHHAVPNSSWFSCITAAPKLTWNTRETRGNSTKFFVPTV